MAISLNSINTRVTSLESKIASTGVFKVIYSGVGYNPGTYSFNTSIDNFDMLVFGSYYANDGLGARIYNTTVISVADFKKYQAITSSESENLRYKFISTTSFQMSRSGGLLGSPVYGLKLYYSFSYNIIYKILRSKISRLCQKFTLLKQKECEIVWL